MPAQQDAQELAPEFAEAPATETRYEEKYIISLLQFNKSRQFTMYQEAVMVPVGGVGKVAV